MMVSDFNTKRRIRSITAGDEIFTIVTTDDFETTISCDKTTPTGVVVRKIAERCDLYQIEYESLVEIRRLLDSATRAELKRKYKNYFEQKKIEVERIDIDIAAYRQEISRLTKLKEAIQKEIVMGVFWA
ncbi:hypothetical protein NTE_01215 [Candidatus Nitrososphaera evergladensis SR1]|uniref:Uncharacterized protein n=1 Tax=Candidatus Nitrososphaera evergladensis SR1 TaxID=1459636 RepID=A0A075MR46_9ARCH|nr:hypothetical protein [Candidatus Nitrososphaera evergladensis]AIF83287.1 hypothetical protein NTE_01215 [Candidatus Nitrososphaera evergladensis SR1]